MSTPNPAQQAKAAKRDDGGPAFARPMFSCPSEYSEAQRGMSLRAWFAGHAPINHLWHFEVPMATPRPEPLGQDEDGMPMNWKDVAAWDNEKKRRAFAMWPWVWADAVLAERRI